MPDRVFFDTNLWVYLHLHSEDTEDIRKKKIVARLLKKHPDIVISAQVLNELANVFINKYHLPAGVVKERLEETGRIVEVKPLTEQVTFKALKLLEDYNLSFFDALVVSSAIEAGCSIVFTEDMQAGQSISGKTKIVNPFR